MERAWVDARAWLGDGLTGPYQVVLYTRDEFAAQFGIGAASGVLGFYSGKIRMNLSENMNERYQATALHELVHAALDQLAGGRAHELPTWLNEGLARWVERKALSGDFLRPRELALVAQHGSSMPLAQLAHVSFAHLGRAAELGYAKSSAAVQALVGRGEGMAALTRLARAIGAGESFEHAFAAEFGAHRLATLDEEANRLAR
jgi:hypothetical protein